MRLGAFDDHQLRSCRAMGDFEALATSCRDAAFRESLSATDVWSVATAALNDCLRILKANVVSSVANSVSQTDASESGVADQDDDDDGLGYTLRVSKGQLPDVNSAEDIAARAVTVCDREAVEVAVETATSVLRFLRNASAGVCANQDACRISNSFGLTHDIIIGCCEWIEVDDDAISSAVVLLQQVALQFSVNFVTGNSANQAAAWNAYFPDHFQKILVECQEHRKVCAFTAALIMNCINSTDDTENKTITFVNDDEEEPASSGQRRTDLVCARNLVITLLQRCMPKPVAYNSSTSGLQGDVDAPDAEDPTFEWICLLFRVLFRAGHARDLYNAVGAHMLSRLWSRVTPEQLILLRMLSVWVDHVASSLRTIEHAHHDDPEVLALVSTVDFVKATWVYIISTDEEDRPDDVEPVRKLMWIDLENEAKLLLLEVLGEITVSCRQELSLSYEDTSKELLRSVLTELRRVWKLRPNNPKPNSTSKPSRTQTPIVVSEDSGEKEPEGYRSRLIRVAGNLCFRDTARQDLVREEEFIPLLLAHCNVDDQNPLIREWALVALRNLCEGNEANQMYIDAMRPQSRETDNFAAKTED